VLTSVSIEQLQTNVISDFFLIYSLACYY
jgi:hypothetical protein